MDNSDLNIDNNDLNIDNNSIIQQLAEIESKVQKLIEALKLLKTEKSELLEKINKYELELLEKSEKVELDKQQSVMIKNRFETLLGKLNLFSEG